VTERESPPLFDLPLFKDEGDEEKAAPETAEAEAEAERPRPAPTVAGDSFPFELADPPPERAAPSPGRELLAEPAAGEPEDEGDADEPIAAEPRLAPLVPRLAAGLLDGGVLLSVSAIAIVGSFLLGVRWQLDDLPPLALFLAIFSLLYSAVPLAFWGRTPGMALVRLIARDEGGGPLTFGQTALRWAGGLATLLLAGLPLFLATGALGGRSLADRLSGSRCWLEPPS
jgi:uncharacterized RDD family membrane protein YckC